MHVCSTMTNEEAEKIANEYFNRGYRVTSRKFCIISRVDMSDEEMVNFFIKRNFGDRTSGVPCADIESQRDQYRRVHSHDKIEGVHHLVCEKIRSLTKRIYG